MRIVSGRLGGRHLKSPPGNVTRPTSERVREAVASALEARDLIAGRRVIDLYAGTGALGFEALSRGASHVVFVERDARVAKALEQSAQSLGVAQEVDVLKLDLSREKSRTEVLRHGPFGLVLMDPPYADMDVAIKCLQALCEGGLLADEAVVLLEHAAKTSPVFPASLIPLSRYRYGDTAVALLAKGDDLR